MLFITHNVPKSLRGDLTRWMLELKPGVFLGTLSTLVGEKLWNKIQERQDTGGAIWVKATNNEQRFKISISGNTNWALSDFDGLQLITHPIEKNLTRNKEIGKAKMNNSELITSRKDKRSRLPKINWDTKNTPANFIMRKALFNYENTQFDSKYMGSSAYGEYPPECLWKKPWIIDLEVLTKSLLSYLCNNFEFYTTNLKLKKIACLDIETTDFLPKAYEGYVNIIGISILDLKNFKSGSSSILLFQAFNMTRKKVDVPKLLKLAYRYLEDIDTLIVFNKNFDIKIITNLINEFNLEINLPERIIDLKELFPDLLTLEQYLTNQVGFKRLNSAKGKYSEYYQLFKGEGKNGINKKIEPIGVYNLTDSLTPLYAYLILKKEDKLK